MTQGLLRARARARPVITAQITGLKNEVLEGSSLMEVGAGTDRWQMDELMDRLADGLKGTGGWMGK